jgi:hypothetical protein
LNKYKFNLSAGSVKDLKKLISEKLLAKNHITAESELIIKDVDDY